MVRRLKERDKIRVKLKGTGEWTTAQVVRAWPATARFIIIAGPLADRMGQLQNQEGKVLVLAQIQATAYGATMWWDIMSGLHFDLAPL